MNEICGNFKSARLFVKFDRNDMHAWFILIPPPVGVDFAEKFRPGFRDRQGLDCAVRLPSGAEPMALPVPRVPKFGPADPRSGPPQLAHWAQAYLLGKMGEFKQNFIKILSKFRQISAKF